MVHRDVISLIYHDVVARHERDNAGFAGPVAGAYKLEPEAFAKHLSAIVATSVRIGLFHERPDATLTFDDGGASALWIADQLESAGVRGAFFVVTGRIGAPGFIDAAGVRELVARGHQVGSHSHTHPAHMGRLQPDELAQEWTTSREALAQLLGGPPRSAAVPGGSVSSAVIEEAARAGYKELYTSTPRARPSSQAGITVLGRYTVWASDPPELAAAIARGDRAPRARRWLGWQVKSGAKRLSPRAYEALRRARASVRNDASRAV